MDRPEHLHAIAERMTEVRMAEMRILEEKGLLGYGMRANPLHRRPHDRAAEGRVRPGPPARDRQLDRRPALSANIG